MPSRKNPREGVQRRCRDHAPESASPGKRPLRSQNEQTETLAQSEKKLQQFNRIADLKEKRIPTLTSAAFWRRNGAASPLEINQLDKANQQRKLRPSDSREQNQNIARAAATGKIYL
ncbi:hypothetical protein KIF59_21085 [Enterobacter cloacae subsp. cloacae]|nr:hypothetical protein [Enterobacter cloacae subsp. cloacae]